MRKRMLRRMPGQDIAEMEIEARRDAADCGWRVRGNPYPKGSFEALCYTSECQQHWRKTNGI